MTRNIARTTTIFAAFALVAGASVPAAAANDPSAKPLDAKPAKEKRYCASQVTTGSMLRREKVCRTRSEWIARTGQDPVRK